MGRVVIVGAGGHGSVVADILRAAGAEVAGFLDDAAPVGELRRGVPVLGRPGDAVDGPLVVAVGDNAARRAMVERLGEVRYATAVHPSAVVAPDAAIGPGAMICAAAVVGTGAQVGAHAILNTSCSVDHDCRVGAFTHIAPGVHLGGDVTIGEGCLIGIGALVLRGLQVGDGATVGAGAVVTHAVEPGATVVGVPAR